MVAAAQPVLLQLCIHLSPYLRDAESFITLLEETPEFSIRYLKALLGRPDENPYASPVEVKACCRVYNRYIPLITSQEPPPGLHYQAKLSLAFSDRVSSWCSKRCYDITLNGFHYAAPNVPQGWQR